MMTRSARTVFPDSGPVTATRVPTVNCSRTAGALCVPKAVCPFSATVTAASSAVEIVQLSPSMAVI